jgi:hypothetical protein
MGNVLSSRVAVCLLSQLFSTHLANVLQAIQDSMFHASIATSSLCTCVPTTLLEKGMGEIIASNGICSGSGQSDMGMDFNVPLVFISLDDSWSG